MNYRLDLKPEPDGYGYIYGQLRDGNAHHRVDIMPPIDEWHGQRKMTGGAAPHPTDWVIFIDGEEVARVRKREEIESILARRLNKPPS